MPTVFTHPAVPLAIGLGLGKDVISTPLLIAGVAVSMSRILTFSLSATVSHMHPISVIEVSAIHYYLRQPWHY